MNYFDTADLYDRGQNEALLGRALSSYRQTVIIATKVGNDWSQREDGWRWNPSKAHILKSIDDSLRRLRTDYIDLYQLHGGTADDRFEEIIGAFERLKDAGKIKAYGLSSIRPNVFSKYLRSSNIASNMMQYSALDTRPEEYMATFEEHSVSVIARGSLARGLLVNKPIEEPYLTHSLANTLHIKNTLADAAQKLGTSTQMVALKYATAPVSVASAVVGVRTWEQLQELKEVLSAWDRVDKQVVLALLGNLPKIHYQDHRD